MTKLSSYYLAPSLVVLRAEINRGFPSRDKGSDGWIGDPSHQASVSDHNPDYSAGGVVRAIDVDKDGIDANHLVAVLCKDSRIEYVIWAGHIYSRGYGFRKRAYNGSNGHYHHVHVSLRHGASYATNRSPWHVLTRMVAVARTVAVKRASTPSYTKPSCASLQTALHVSSVDGKWGPATDKAGDALRNATDFYHKKFPYGVAFTQQVVGTSVDNDWGGNSVKALTKTVTEVQKALATMHFYKSKPDGKWGPVTETAYQNAKKACHI